MPKLSKEEYAAKKRGEVKNLLQDVKDGISSITSGDDWKRLLKFQSQFHTYSFNNQILIWHQRPHSTYVAGFKAWQKLGRNVKKGEKGIKILAPNPFKVKSEGDDEKVIMRFRTTHVFDISQTEGEDVPQNDFVKLLDGETDRAYDAWHRGIQYAKSIGFDVDAVTEIEECPPANGACFHSDKKIVIKEASKDQMAKTLIHELAHATMHGDLGGYDKVHSRAYAEVEAESTAYVVAGLLGLDTSDYSFGYIAEWSNGDTKMVTESGERICKCVQSIMSFIQEDEKNDIAA